MRENVEKCYGVECLQCTESDCNLKRFGIDVIREKKAEWARRTGANRMIEYSDALDSGTAGSGEQAAVTAFLHASDDVCGDTAGLTSDLSGWKMAAEALRRLYWMLKVKPETTMRLMDILFLGEDGRRQSDIARAEGISREAVRRRVKRDIEDYADMGIPVSGIARTLGMRAETAGSGRLRDLTPEESAVYKIRFENGCTIRSTAAQLKKSVATVNRLIRKIRSKLQKNDTRKRRGRRKKRETAVDRSRLKKSNP